MKELKISNGKFLLVDKTKYIPPIQIDVKNFESKTLRNMVGELQYQAIGLRYQIFELEQELEKKPLRYCERCGKEIDIL